MMQNSRNTRKIAVDVPGRVFRLLRIIPCIPCFLFILIFGGLAAQQSGTATTQQRRLPPPGIAVAPADRAALEASLAALGREIAALRARLRAQPLLLDLLPDVEIYYEAVNTALNDDQFFDQKEIPVAARLLKQGLARAKDLAEGRAPWTTATGLVVRGYRSRVDDSVQPYGLIVPDDYRPDDYRDARRAPRRLDIWFHGRHEKLSEVNFIDDRERNRGQFAPAGAFVLHPYGRYCNANKFAGEIDTFEALAHVRSQYPIDENRLVVRGFSMGGAAAWHFATHHAGMWAAAAPGAGFAETAEYLRIFQTEPAPPAWYEQKLWHLYDSTDYAANLYHCPTIAYSGEIDRQIQAAQIMSRAMAAEGLELQHIIGPQTAHAYHPESKLEIDRRIDALASRGRDPAPRRVRFTTWTLRYNRMLWVEVDAMGRHWERARVDADVVDRRRIEAKTQNVTGLTFSMPPGSALAAGVRPEVVLDGQRLASPPVPADRFWTVHFRRRGERWTIAGDPRRDSGNLRKRHSLQGPIDDAFMDRFLFVRPTGPALDRRLGTWVESELNRALLEWRRQFRGAPRVKNDTEVTAEDIASSHLILWGDPQSNRLMRRIASRLPLVWDRRSLKLGGEVFDSSHHAPVMIYPNPLNPTRYVVLNSGHTFREYDYSSNARQVPKLPDYAVIDLDTPPSPRSPGRIAAAGFFGERWELGAQK